MKIFITGASGYVGNRLAHTLADQGNEVHALVRSESSASILRHPNIRLFIGDITRKATISRAIQGCTHVYHTAALVKFWSRHPVDFYSINVEGTGNVLSEAMDHGIEKVVCVSSCGVLGHSLKEPLGENDPRISAFDNDYELSKFMAENVAKDYARKGLFVNIVSPSKVYGPGVETHPVSVNRVIKKFIEKKMAFVPSPLKLIANYSFIDDVVKGCQLALTRGTSGENYILGGENVSYSDFFERLRIVTGIRGVVVPAPKIIVQSIALAMKLASNFSGHEPFVTAKGVKHLYCNKAFNSNKAITTLGYKITPLTDGLKQTVQFLKNNSHAA